jgi:predicted SprT family Zn-dependent metalloprotease
MECRIVEQRAREELSKWGLDREGWTFAWGRGVRQLGVCRYRHRRIEVSREYARLNGPELVIDTLLHEVAHALTPGANHGPAWQAACVRVGCRPQRCKDAAEVVSRPAPWQIRCPQCGKLGERHRRPTAAWLRGRIHATCRTQIIVAPNF